MLLIGLLLNGMFTFSQVPSEVYKYCKKVGIQHVDIVMKQVILETGWLQCTNCSLDHNNIFGFRWKKKYLEYPDWRRSVYYMKWWQNRHYKGGDYYQFLVDRGYATDEEYVDKVKSINIRKIFHP